ncbi:MAG: hypothetical protein MJ238_03735 [Bacilli bacterium]|nr:hypothetical protein [Bacilli bacterium]
MKIKVSKLMSTLHESNLFNEENRAFIKGIEECLGSSIELSPISDYDCDVKLIFIASGGSEGLFLENIANLKAPYYLLTNGANNSLAASLEILTYLNNHNLKGEILHGSDEYIANRIKELADSSVEEAPARLGVIGKPSDWLISSIPNYESVKQAFNIELVDIPLSESIENYKSLTEGQKYRCDYFSQSEINNAEKFHKALEAIVEKYQLDGLTIRCFDLLSTIRMTGCLALSEFNDDGIIGTCEGDIMAMISMYLVKKLFNQSSFQANPSRIDVEKSRITLAHCTLPKEMTDSWKFHTHFESKIGVAIKGEVKLGPVTVFRLSSDLKHYFLEEGEIIENLNDSNLCRTQVIVELPGVSSLLKNPCGNHHIIFFGHHKAELEEFLSKIIK